METNARSNSKQRRLAYIMGPNYSGSTLLTLLLADHPEIATVGELKATSMGDVSTYQCSCGTVLSSCPFWNQVEDAMHQKGSSFSLNNFGTHFRARQNPLADRLFRAALRGRVFEIVRASAFLLLPAARAIRQKIIEQNREIIEVICTLQQAKTFLDDSKEPIRLKFLLAANYWDVRVIHLIRDGRGVANSYMRHNKVPMAKAVKEWMHTQQECDRMARLLGSNRCLTLHYEDLCREPQKNLAAILVFLGLNPEAGCSVNRTKHIMGNQMRLGSFQDVRLDEKWRQTLSPEDARLFTAIAGELNRLHGYS